MKILITGSDGFIAKNLIAQLQNKECYEILKCNRRTSLKELDKYIKECEFIFHLAGINRARENKTFWEGNVEFTLLLLQKLKKYNNKSTIVFSSSIQAQLQNTYGKTKKECEKVLLSYAKENKVKVIIYRLPNVFGKWCKPNYNSVIATFCYNISRNMPIKIQDKNITLNLAYIDDVVEEFIKTIDGNETFENSFGKITNQYNKTLGEIAMQLKSFKDIRKNKFIPNTEDEWTKKLYSTYLSYLPENQFEYEIQSKSDNRGSFSEIFKTKERGQISINTINPKQIKGNHWHNTKNEKFIVVSGEGIIRFRKINSKKIIQYYVNENDLKIIDIPVGYVHQIENTGISKMTILIWSNELYDPKKTDTYYEEV